MIAGIVSTLTLPITAVLFGLARITLPIVYRLPLVPSLLRPFTAHFLRGSWTILLPLFHLPLILKAWFIAFTTLTIWEFTNAIFDTIIFQVCFILFDQWLHILTVFKPVTTSGLTAEPHMTLVSGVFSSDTGFRYWAYNELNSLASDDSTTATQQRSSLFNDQKHPSNLWNHLLRESLITLGKDYQFFLRRGQVPIPTAIAPPPAPTQKHPLVGTPAQLIRTSVFQSSKQISPIRTVVESLGSDGPLAQALDAGAEAAHIPELFRSVEAAVLPVPAKEEVKKAVEQAASLPDTVWRRMKDKAREVLVRLTPEQVTKYSMRLDTWWNRERLGRTAQSYLPHAELDVAIVEGTFRDNPYGRNVAYVARSFVASDLCIVNRR